MVKLCGRFKRIFDAVNLIFRALDDDEVLPLNCFHLPPRKLGPLTVKASAVAAAASAMTGPNNAPFLLPLPPRSTRPAAAPICHKGRCGGAWFFGRKMDRINRFRRDAQNLVCRKMIFHCSRTVKF